VHVTERLKIDTPEQVALEMPIAGIGSRFLALAVDTLVQLFLFVVASIVLGQVSPAILRILVDASPIWLMLGPSLLILFSFCLYWGYFACFEILWKGQTPGKRVAGIRVVKDSGRPVDVPAAILRNLIRAIDFLPAMYATGVTCMLLNRHSRRLGDFVAGTVVVHDHRATDIGAGWNPAGGPAISIPQVTRLTDDEVVLIETYLDRRFDLPERASDRAASQIARRIKDRTGLEPAPGQTMNDFLEAIARQARDSARFR
jgi:uncharacterized RDD family membrane protein YckC